MLLESFLLGMIQGLTEFLPVSSSAHLIIVPYFFKFKEAALDTNLFDAVLHGGSLAAIVVVFRKRILDVLKTPSYLVLLALSAMPALAAGLLLSPYKDAYLRGVGLCAFSLVFFGVYMIVAERTGRGSRTSVSLGAREFLLLGAAQALALIPGTSRSGITIATALLLNMKKEDAVEISFLMGLPVIAAAFAHELRHAILVKAAVPLSAISVGLASSFVFGLLALFFLVRFIKSFKFSNFAYYRFLIAFIILAHLWKTQ